MNMPSTEGTVYLLGAGASSELQFQWTTLDPLRPQKHTDFSASGPLSSGFFYYMERFSREVQNHSRTFPPMVCPEVITKYVCETYSPLVAQAPISARDLLNDESKSKLVNIEKLCVHLSQEDSLDKLLLKRWLETYIVDSLSYISFFCLSQRHQAFVSSLKGGETIISFNWDILLEQALSEKALWNYETGYGMKFRSVAHKSDEWGEWGRF